MARIVELALYTSHRRASTAFLEQVLPELAGPRPRTGCRITYVSATRPDSSSPGPFWKYTVFCDDVEAVRDRVVRAGIDVTRPVQFLDIGYLCHFTDPGGVEIELLQRTFERSATVPTPGHEQLGLITLRVDEASGSQHFYEQLLGMKPLAVMTVDDGRPDPFDLSFYAFTDESPPSDDLWRVENREWLYQRPYPMIELQHVHSEQVSLDDDHGAPGSLAFVAIELESSESERTRKLASAPTGHRLELRANT